MSLLPAFVALNLAKVGSGQGQLRPAPTAVILSGVGDNGVFKHLIDASDKVTVLRTFQKFENDLLCSKQGDNSYIFVKKSFPAYARLRFRRHALDLLVKKRIWQRIQLSRISDTGIRAICKYSLEISASIRTERKYKNCFSRSLEDHGHLQQFDS